jgi:hypothetical protein
MMLAYFNSQAIFPNQKLQESSKDLKKSEPKLSKVSGGELLLL